MDRDEWWSRLSSTTKQWLIDHNGEPLPVHVVDEIVAVNGPIAEDPAWAAESDASGLLLTDEAVDWIESVANGERPER